jgi:hypothetical protein
MYTHKEIVERARKWLTNTKGCLVVLVEWSGGPRETPDAIGFKNSGRKSILVECKATYSDFEADGSKYFRKIPGRGLGEERYYMAPPGIIPIDEVPANWGLLEVHEDKIRVIKKAKPFDRGIASLKSEVLLLYNVCRCVVCETKKDLDWFRLSESNKRLGINRRRKKR